MSNISVADRESRPIAAAESSRTETVLEKPPDPRAIGKRYRMRLACNGCNHSKLRCNGDRNGCSRCRKHGLTCEYSISMVGRASKRGQLKIRENSQRFSSILALSDVPNGQMLTETTAPESQNVANLLLPSPLSNGDEDLSNLLDDNAECDHIFDLSAGTFFTDAFLHDGGSGSNHTSIHSLGRYTQDLHWTHEQHQDLVPMEVLSNPGLFQQNSFAPSHLQAPLTGEQPLPPFQPNDLLPGTQDAHESHMQTLTKIITSLDTHVRTGAISIDEVMRTSKICINGVTSIMNLNTYNRCRTCKTFICTALELLVKLYEIVLDPTSNAQLQHGKLPSLYFGVFEIGLEEQAAICKQIISNELQRVLPFVHILSSGCGAEMGSESRKWHQQALSEMVHRVEKLNSTITT